MCNKLLYYQGIKLFRYQEIKLLGYHGVKLLVYQRIKLCSYQVIKLGEVPVPAYDYSKQFYRLRQPLLLKITIYHLK